jgi:hypothetical protein
VAQIWSDLPMAVKDVIRQELKMRNYREDVFEDEFQAYCTETHLDFGKKVADCLIFIHKQLKANMKFPTLTEDDKISLVSHNH